MKRLAWTLLLGLLAPLAWGFELAELGARLAARQPVSGAFVQEKHLRALPQPLVSQGRFELSAAEGLLWQLREPLAQDYRISERGIFRLDPDGWQAQPGQDAASQQSRLFLAVLRGDHSGLARDFELDLQGSAEDWQLEMRPRGALLKQIFSLIRIEGGAEVEQIELLETQGDRTRLRLTADAADHAD